MEFTAQQTLSNAMNQNRIHLLIFIQQMQHEVLWRRHTSQAKGSSLLSKTSNIKEKEKKLQSTCQTLHKHFHFQHIRCTSFGTEPLILYYIPFDLLV